MKRIGTSLFIAAMLVASSAAQGFAADQSRYRGACPARQKGDTYANYLQRNSDFCEVRWRDMVATNTTGGQTHDHFIRSCKRKCFRSWDADGELALLLGSGVAVGFALADLGGGGSPPPASP
jgi:hypothetical protein